MVEIKRVMISQPMTGVSEEEIIEAHDRAKKYLESKGYRVIETTRFNPSLINKEMLEAMSVLHEAVYILSGDLKAMCNCNTIYFCKDWEKSRSCRAEYELAKIYGYNIIFED